MLNANRKDCTKIYETYIVSQKIMIHLTFNHNFGKYGPIIKILSLTPLNETV